ncbi:MAG: xanthine dehydrogenase family protein molybdopterin-binding subunit [Betaproteobacteria bacterium]|nr:MAG: xanthine dehydrogenase family protein molybdopterin-binding subunit [Betaproteobacteria bacterium]
MTRYGIGQPVRRVEDQRFLTGRARYVDDIQLPHMLHGAVVMSPHAHARIKGIDASAAQAMPGVHLVLTGADAQREKLGGIPPLFMPEDMGGPKGYRTFRPLLEPAKARYVGDRIAFVVADTPELARIAAERIEVDYEPLPAVVNVADAAKEGAPKVWDDNQMGNLAFPLMMGNKDATDAAFAKAKHTVSVRLYNNRITANTMEPRACIGDYNAADDAYTLHTSSQNPHGVRTILCGPVFHMPEIKLRVVSPDVGGGFGMKGDIYPEDGLVLWASRRLGRPVKWVATRTESLLGDNHGRDQLISAEMALDDNGKILAIRAQALHAVGAYVTNAGVVPVLCALRNIPNVYVVPAMLVASKATFTHTTPLGPYRGAGRPEASYVIERLMDEAARKLNMDPVELRRRNYIAPSAMPYNTTANWTVGAPVGWTYDSGDFAKLTDRAIELADWGGFQQRKKQSEANSRLRGRSLIYYLEDSGVFNERMEVRFDPSGMVTIVAGTHSHGQGHATTYAQLASDWLGVPFESIRLVQGDTDAVSFGRGTYASRSAMLGGSALRAASDAIIEKAKPLAAHLLEAAAADLEFKQGKFNVVGTDRGIPLVDVAKAFYRPVGPTTRFGAGLDASGSSNAPPTFPNGCHVCELEIDPETGEVTIDRYVVVDDVGRVINPLICHGQIEGALAQGIGQALMENVAFDPESGQMLSASFTDYALPRASDLPLHYELDFIDVPAKTNPLGVKGIGEAGCVGAPPAVMNAILDALRPRGVTHLDMPATPRRVWEALNSALSTK